MSSTEFERQATGTFEVQLTPIATHHDSAETGLSRMAIDKTFSGDLVGESHGEMLSGGQPAEGSAGYVAIERVAGTLHGTQGSFCLQHFGTMQPGSQQLRVEVVPGSGTGELGSLRGNLAITIEDGVHRYTFDYTLAS